MLHCGGPGHAFAANLAYNFAMSKFTAVLQVIAALILIIAAVATLVNLIFISTRPETISVVNTMIGQGVLIICLFALGRILLRRGLKKFREEPLNGDS